MQHALIANWIPYRLHYSAQGNWLAKWLDLGNQRMVHPFFDETISVCRCRQKERSSLESLSTGDFLPAACNELVSLAPTAFIFHVSRCGSTLLSQAFSAPDENIVIAEAPLLDDILRAEEKDPEISVTTQEAWFRSAVTLMGQQRNFKENSYIIKLDSWHIHFYERLREWFPQTPFFFLYRKPDEVIASHEKKRGIHAVPGMISNTLLKTDGPAHYQGDLNRYTARVLEQYYLAMQHIRLLGHPNNSFYDYADGVREMVETFSAFTNIPVKDSARVNERLVRHSKSPQELFRPELHINDERYFFADCHSAYEQLRSLLL